MESIFAAQDTEDPGDRSPAVRRRSKWFLGDGLRLLLHNKRLLLWAWLASVLAGLVCAVPFHSQLSDSLNHSLAAQKISGQLDASYLVELLMRTGQHSSGMTPLLLLAAVVSALFAFVLAAGAYFVFLSATAPRLRVVLDSGIAYFWRFVRFTILALLLSGILLGILSAARSAFLKSADATHVERSYFVLQLASLAIVALVAGVLRFYFDLAEATIVRMGIAGDRRVRRSWLPALRIFRHTVLRAFLGYILTGCIGVALFSLFISAWIFGLPPSATLSAHLLGELGILCLIASRLWQRAIAAAAVLRSAERVFEPPQGEVPAHQQAPEPGPVANETIVPPLVAPPQDEGPAPAIWRGASSPA